MKLAISNIGWNMSENDTVFETLKRLGYTGLEIAPTVIHNENPYDNIDVFKEYFENIKNEYGISLVSMQSIWYGVTGNIFIEEDRKHLIDYTKKLVDFASELNCKNIVFGCPKNRNIPDNMQKNDAVEFFEKISNYANEKGTNISLEPNPTIYGTNFINTTTEAVEFIKKNNLVNLKINVDFGTIIENNEDFGVIEQNIKLINHIHISEPYLELIKERSKHKELIEILKNNNYDKYVSIEMKQQKSDDVVKVLEYCKELTNGI